MEDITIHKNYKIKNTKVTKYWNENAKELSEKIWIPSEEEMKEKERILSGSWFNATKVTTNQVRTRIGLPKDRYDEMDDPVSKNPLMQKEQLPIKVKMIPLEFYNWQRKMIDSWFDDARLYYNTTITYLKDNSDEQLKFGELRTKINNLLEEKYKSVKNTPRDVRDESVKEAQRAVIQAKLSYKENGIFCNVTFRAKKDKEQAIYIPKASVKKDIFYPSYLEELKYCKGIINKFDEATCACKLIRNKIGYFLVIPVEYKPLENKKGKIMAIDPVVRTFLTGYSQNSIIEIGSGSISKVNRIRRRMDNIQSDMTKVGAKKRYKMKKAKERLQTKIQNLLKDCHFKAGKYLTTEHSRILIPAFNVKDMTNRNNRKMRKITVKDMIDWRHYMFRQRLLHQARKYNCSIVIVNESYTSKTCSMCGHIHHTLGGSKVFKCPNCYAIIGRDVNGARGIYIRSMIDE